MATYLIQIAFTADAISKLVKKPENRLEAVIPLVESLGGHFVGSWMSFGEYDSTAVIEMPDNLTIKAFSMAAMAGGSLRFINVTPLMAFDEGVAAMKVAQEIAYRAPT